MDADRLYRRYQDLQSYVGWTEEDAERVRALRPMLEPCLLSLIEDFFCEMKRHPSAHKVITGGQAQVDRLKDALLGWLRDLLTGPYDCDYVVRRWRVGARHAELGLQQVYTNVALCRLRTGMVRALAESWNDGRENLILAIQSLNKLLDLDLAKIEDAYQAEYTARLQARERLATLGQIVGGLAHELRNPLNVVKSSVYFLLNARSLPAEKQVEHLHRIERSVELANDVITALSNFARMPHPEPQPFPIDACLREALDDGALSSGIDVVFEMPPELPPVLADRGQIRIALGNLIRNARDAMPSGGRLTLVGRKIDDEVELDVVDTGVGIPTQDLGRIMEPLYSTKARGLGLGLALSRMILEKNRATLQVASELGKGSTFTVRLKCAGEDTSQSAGPEPGRAPEQPTTGL